MRVDPNALNALQSRLLSLMRGPDEARAQSFKVDGPPPAQPQPGGAAASAALPAASLATLLAASAAPASRQAVLRRAEKGLAGLERLHRLIRSGGSTSEALDELADWQDDSVMGDGPEGALLDEVKLRVLVELAKEGR